MFYSCETKGLAMASIPSTGQINTTAVPLNNSHELKICFESGWIQDF
jgi:hypothetical protein